MIEGVLNAERLSLLLSFMAALEIMNTLLLLYILSLIWRDPRLMPDADAADRRSR